MFYSAASQNQKIPTTLEVPRTHQEQFQEFDDDLEQGGRQIVLGLSGGGLAAAPPKVLPRRAALMPLVPLLRSTTIATAQLQT